MKSSFFSRLGLAIGLCLTMVACSQPQDQEPVDARDVFVGAYDYQAEGAVDLYVAGTKLTSLPLNDTGVFEIHKYGADNQVVIVGYNDSIRAMVFGNELVLESNAVNYDYGQIHAQLIFSYGRATLAGRNLDWQSDVVGTATYGSYAANANGQITLHATKQ